MMQLPTSSALGGCTDFPPDELSSEEELDESDELELPLELSELELLELDSEPSVSAELSLWPSTSSSGWLGASSLEESSPSGAGSVSSPAGGGSLPSMEEDELSLESELSVELELSLEEESESD